IGVKKIDEQHERLFSKVNEPIYDILKGGDYQKEKNISTVLFLKEYAVTHFADEEEYQLSIDDPNYPIHKKMHEDFIATVLKHESNMVASDFAHKDVSKFTGTLFAWLIYHVSDVDQKIGKVGEDSVVSDGHSDIICECFRHVISNVINVNEESITKIGEHNESFDGSITVKHSFAHVLKGYIVFKYSVSFINELIRFLTGIIPEENIIDDFEKTFLLQISTTTVENIYRRLFVDKYELNELEVFITDKNNDYDQPPTETIALDTKIGIAEVGFTIES
ncbi:MAG: hemerythrin family protein, partial [Oscillospiraceae bacterium]|nr:hemerythrin family protein [Oscillospiraceae bacterium]